MRNIHFAAAAAITAPAVAHAHVSHVEQPSSLDPRVSDLDLPAQRLRTRIITVSPAEEYALRPGKVRPITDAFAAMILSYQGRAEVTAKGLVVDRKELGARRTYHHPDSIICNDLSSRERKWFYVLNRQNPDRVHILSDQGEYIETLPLAFMPQVLNREEQAAVAAAHKRQIRRVSRHLQELQSDATAQAIEDLRHNAEHMTRYVQTFDAPAGADRHQAPEPAPDSPLGRVLSYDRAHKQAAARRASTLDLGRAIATTRAAGTADFSPQSQARDLPSEDWSDHPRNLSTPAAPIRQTSIVEETW